MLTGPKEERNPAKVLELPDEFDDVRVPGTEGNHLHSTCNDQM